ncbi:hypothetical protein RIF29_32897 [Crotalaria pallida]|uniref:Uncharacterized protein n=1 Tax=Crotalaria pallida TaxID=3830 RepID=A0AAN9HTR3_CROPI
MLMVSLGYATLKSEIATSLSCGGGLCDQRQREKERMPLKTQTRRTLSDSSHPSLIRGTLSHARSPSRSHPLPH